MGCIKGALAHIRWRPILMTGLLRQLLIKHFADMLNIEDPDLKAHSYPAIWRDDLETGILIESNTRWRGALAEKRPAILIKRNEVKNVRLTVNDLNKTDSRGFQHFVTMWVGSHTLFVIFETGASVEGLATEVQRELTEFGPAIVEQLALHKFQVLSMGEIGELEEATENYVVPVTVGWAYQEAWKLEPEALTLMGVDIVVGPGDL